MSPTPTQIRATREGCLWERKDVAALLSVTPSCVEKWELGVRRMPRGLWHLMLALAVADGRLAARGSGCPEVLLWAMGYAVSPSGASG